MFRLWINIEILLKFLIRVFLERNILMNDHFGM